MALVQLFGSTYKLGERGNGTQDLINFFFESYTAGNTKSDYAIVPTPGFDLVKRLSENPLDKCKGLYTSSSGTAPDYRPRMYGVFGTKAYRFKVDMSDAYQIGTIGDYGVPTTQTDNGFYTVIADSVSLFKAKLDDLDGIPTWSQVTLPVVPKTGQQVEPSHVVFIGQRLVINSKNTNYWFFSDLTSPTTLTGGETFQDGSFYSAEQSSDPIIALKNVNGSLWMWGYRSYEVWRPQNNQDDPFAYVGGSAGAIGCEAPYSVAVVGDLCFWLGASDVGASTVFMGQGTTVTDITDGVYDEIISISNRSQAIGYAYKYKENVFYVLTFEAENKTFVYDATTKKWHKRSLRNVNEGADLYYPYQWATVGADGEIYFGLYGFDSCIVRMNPRKFTEWDGRLIRREAVSRPIFDNLDMISIRQLMIDCEVGSTEILDGQGSNPQMCMQISKDGGNTYGLSVKKYLGKQGNYRQLVRWNNIGACRYPVFKLWISDGVPCSIFNARLEYNKWGLS